MESCLFFFDKNLLTTCCMVPPTQLQLMCHPCTCALMNGFQQPLNLSRKKALAVSPSYAQNKAQMNHPHRLLVAVSNATRILLRC